MIPLLLSLVALSAHATVPDTYGSGARLTGMAGGGVAVVQDGAAAAVNPAGLYRIRRPTVTMGLSAAVSQFDDVPDLYWDTNQDGTIDERDPPLVYSAQVDPAVGLSISAGRNVGGKFAIGLSGYVPTAHLIRFSTFEPELPTYFMYDNRPQRYSMAVGIGGQIVEGISVGAGIDFVPSARYTLALSVDAEIVGTTNEDGEVEDLVGDVIVDVHEMDLDVIPGYAPILGTQIHVGQWVSALEDLWLGASYRGSVGLPIHADLELQANISAEDIGSLDPIVMAIVLDAGLGLFDHYVPAQLSLGMAYRSEEVFTAYLDARYTVWRPMILNITRVTEADITSPLVEIDDFVHDGNAHDVVLANVWSVRTGSELLLPPIELTNKLRYLRFMVRGGFMYEPSPLVSQGQSSALLDADRMGFALGGGTEFWDPFTLVDGPVRIDLFLQHHVLASGALLRGTDTPKAGYPVAADSIPIGGSIWMAGAQWGFDY